MTALLKGLSGYIPVRNNFRLDYCAQLGVQSLLPICDEVIIGNSESDDGTREFFEDWAKREPRLRIVDRPWPVFPTFDQWQADQTVRPPADPVMLVKWINDIREYCRYDTQINLDADEVVCPKAYPEILRAVKDRIPRWFHRINFWGDHRHEAPHGTVCGEKVARLGPTDYEMPSDEPRPHKEARMRNEAIFNDTLRIFHLGFLRKPEAFFAKSKVMQPALLNTYDLKLLEAEKTGKSWVEISPFPKGMKLIPYYNNDYPDYVRAWLRERGYDA